MVIHALTPDAGSQRAVLMPGDVGIGLAGHQLYTLLGSCVAVILTDARRTVGAMCHIVHVGSPPASDAGNTSYGTPAMHCLFQQLRTLGFNPRLCQAFVYGGGNMFPGVYRGDTVGERNVKWVLDFLAAERIEVLEYSLRGVGSRTVSWTIGPAWPEIAQWSDGME